MNSAGFTLAGIDDGQCQLENRFDMGSEPRAVRCGIAMAKRPGLSMRSDEG
jgi:hypothetical protein